MEGKLLGESRKTTLPDEEDEVNLDEHAFDIEIERMYLEKLREQRHKIETLTAEHRALKDELEQKEQLLVVQGRKVTVLAEQASFKRKYEDTARALKQSEAECERLERALEQLRDELVLCTQEKNTTAKEMKTYLKETDLKLNEELCVLREVVDEKQKMIEGLKARHAEELKRLSEEAFRRQLQAQAQQDQTADRLKWLTDELADLNRQLAAKDEQGRKLEAEAERWQRRAVELQQELGNRQAEMDASNDEYKRLFQKMKFHMRSLKKELIDREDEVSRQKQNVARVADAAKKADMKTLELSEQLRLQNNEHQDLISRACFERTQDRQQFKHTARDFANNIDGLLKTKAQLAYENDKLHAVIKHKESTEKIRNSLSGNEHVEINRVERIMRRI